MERDHGLEEPMEQHSPKELGRRLAELRDTADVSTRQLAEALGIQQSAVSRIESGERKLTIGEMIAACEFLGAPVDSLLRENATTVAWRSDGDPAQVEAAKREMRRVIDDFFAFRASAV
jgi:transcriptional regulator with XRE-family HTH domain